MCKFDCSKFLDKCHATCCGIFPFEKTLYHKNIDKIVTNPIKTNEFTSIDPFDKKEKDFIIPVTKNSKCCFLKKDYKCAIYESRPRICKDYGNESSSLLSCRFQDKTGRKRTRQSRRSLDRSSKKNLDCFLKKINQTIKQL